MIWLFMFRQENKWAWTYLPAAGFFLAFILLTKQDYGGLAFVVGLS